MPYDEPDPRDPSVRVGVGLPCSADELEDMAVSFASELAQIGYDAPGILGIFRKPFYAGPHMAYRQLGEARIERAICEAVEFWSHCRVTVAESNSPADGRAVEVPPVGPGGIGPVVERRG